MWYWWQLLACRRGIVVDKGGGDICGPQFIAHYPHFCAICPPFEPPLQLPCTGRRPVPPAPICRYKAPQFFCEPQIFRDFFSNFFFNVDVVLLFVVVDRVPAVGSIGSPLGKEANRSVWTQGTPGSSPPTAHHPQDGGHSLSPWQRHSFCLARVILRRARCSPISLAP